jgi:hypothetical protein
MTKAARAWAGIDAGKAHHHVHVMDADGNRLLSRRVANDEAELTDTIARVLALAVDVTWAIDLADGGAALAIALLLDRQQTVHYVAARLIGRVAQMTLDLDKQIGEIDELIAERCLRHRDAEIITSMPGIGTLLGAEFVAATGGELSAVATADHVAGYGGLAPMPRDSGRRTGNLHRPKRYNRQPQRVFYTSAMISIQRSPASKTYYDRKRAQGKRHGQAVLSLARRRVNVLWALLRDRQLYSETRPSSAAIAA